MSATAGSSLGREAQDALEIEAVIRVRVEWEEKPGGNSL